jgi:uncharacterized repeat protein (TIGR04052 family)
MVRTSFLITVLALAACGDGNNKPDTPADAPPADAPDTTPLDFKLQFTPKVEDQPFACGRTYAHQGAEDTTITPRDFRFYVMNLQLIKADGSKVDAALVQDQSWQYQNVALLDFEDFTGGCQDGTPETNTSIHVTAPRGTYTGVAFDVGIPEAMNHTDLTSMPSPMNLTSLWWGWGFGHIFLAAVSHTDITTPTPGTNDSYVHVGSIGCTGDPSVGETVVCTHPNRPHFELTGLDPTKKAITADYGAVLKDSKLTTDPGCHSAPEAPCAYPFDHVGINWYTGSLTPSTQTLFRIDP